MTSPRVLRYRAFLEDRFGAPVRKISLDAGFSCPTRDGTSGSEGCYYCNNKAFHHSNNEVDALTVLADGIQNLAGRKPGTRVLPYFQAYTNTYGPLADLEKLYRDALSMENVVGLAIGTRPDCLPESVQDLLQELARDHYIQVEVGLQTANDHTLKAIGRGHTVQEFRDAMTQLSGRGLTLGGHMILGLPGEDRSDWQRSAEVLVESGCKLIKIHNFHIVKGSVFGERWSRGEAFPLLTLAEYADAVVDLITRLPRTVTLERLYATAPHSLLLAPDWAADGNRMAQTIEDCLERKDAWQGKCRKDLDNSQTGNDVPLDDA